jgi:flagellar protein FlbD
MIVVTRLNGSQFAVNPDLIERIHANPDTTLVMVDGATYIVTETMDEIIEMIADYRAHVITLARGLPARTHRRGLQKLDLVPPLAEEAALGHGRDELPGAGAAPRGPRSV